MRFPIGLRAFLIVAIVLGVAFRFVNLNHKVYWHDEVYTSMRAAGYTRQDIDRDLFQNRVLPAPELQRFQHIKPGSTYRDTIRSLAIEDPQHPPLYFLLTRVWMKLFDRPLVALFGSSLTTARSLPVLISLLGLPLMYALAWQLFNSRLAALLATTLLALSPFDILFAQTARQYSLLTVMVIASYWALVRAMRGKPRDWVLYSLAVTMGLYTHPFFGLTVIAQGVYAGLEALRQKFLQRFTGFGLALLGAIVLYAPWLVVLVSNADRATATTDWTRYAPGLDYLLKLWTLSFTSLFLDLDFGFNNPVTYLLRLPIVLLIGAALYTLCRRSERSVWVCVLTSILVPFLVLALPDLLLGGKRSAVSRYLIACYPGVQLAIASFFSIKLAAKETSSQPSAPLWRGILALLLTASVVSCTVSALSFTWWNKDLSYFNAETAHRINAVPSAIVVSDIGNDFTNTGDLISLSYLLKPDVRLLLLKEAAWIQTAEFSEQIKGSTPIVFRPSQRLRESLKPNALTPFLPEAQVWRLGQ